LGITSVLLKNGTKLRTNVPTAAEFLGLENRWYEVDALAEDRIFIEDPTKSSDQPGIKVGKYIQTSNRFVSEFTPEGLINEWFLVEVQTSAQDALESPSQILEHHLHLQILLPITFLWVLLSHQTQLYLFSIEWVVVYHQILV
jgi:hypothetical protein